MHNNAKHDNTDDNLKNHNDGDDIDDDEDALLFGSA